MKETPRRMGVPRYGIAGLKRRCLTWFLVVIAAIAAAPAMSTAAPDEATIVRIDEFVEHQKDARRVPGFSFAIVSDGRVVHARGFGAANGSGADVSIHTPFVLGSTSKSFTALAVMQLVDAGTVALDDPIVRYVPALRMADQAELQITVRHLLNQTSGIPALAGGSLLRSVGDGTADEVLRELRGTKLRASPGMRFEYANANYVLLSLVIERGSGESYGAYIERHIFAPLGMPDSFASPEAAKAAGLAEGHRYWFGFAIGHGPTSPDAMRPAGYLMSSAADMARYLAMFHNGGVLDGRRIVSKEGIATLLRPVAAATMGAWSGHHQSRYAMGWYVGGPWQEQVLLHPGGAPDSSSMIVLIPRQRVALVTLANANTEMPIPGADGSLDRIPSGVVSLLVGEQPQTGITLTRFYVIFDAVAALMLAGAIWSTTRLVRREEVTLTGRRRVLQTARGTTEAGFGVLLLALPVLTGQGFAGAMLWMPDLTLVVLVTGAFLVAIGVLRLGLQVPALRRAVSRNTPGPSGTAPPASVAGPVEADGSAGVGRSRISRLRRRVLRGRATSASGERSVRQAKRASRAR